MDLNQDHFDRTAVIGADIVFMASEEGGAHDIPYEVSERVSPKFSSVAALMLWQWSLDSGQDETTGEAQYGNGWHALFRDERAVLHTDSQGFVSAWRLPESEDLDQEWAKIQRGSVYETDTEDRHGDDDPACTSGEPRLCDGTCNWDEWSDGF